mgnify:CR=1 FL=1
MGCCQYEDIISSFKIVSKLLQCRKDLIKFERNINLRGDSESVLMLLNEEAGKTIVHSTFELLTWLLIHCGTTVTQTKVL